MVRRGIRASLSLVVALMGCALPAAAQDGAFWSFLPPGRTLPRCHESTLAHKDAAARLALLDEYFDRVPDTPDAAAAVHEVHALLKSDCFLPAAETDRILNPDSTLALKRWWLDGGRSWLASYLKLPEQGEITKLRPHVVLPPDTRRTLIVSSDPDDPLRPLMCRLDDAACGLETVGWIQRAESAFDAHHAVHLNDDVRLFRDSLSPTASTAEAAAERCAADLPSATNSTRYQAWRHCLESQRPKWSALPLGRIKAPTAGWLIVSGRRGHYGFCDTTSAYDLTTGAAFIHESCSDLRLVADGSVDRALTDAGRLDKVRSGRLSIDNLREALWMMLLQPHAERIQIRAEWYPLPPGVTPETVSRPATADVDFDGVTVSTAQTVLTWRWIRPMGSEVIGEVIWPSSFDASEDHAAALLDVAELGLVPGCVPARAPTESMLGLPEMRVNPVDAPPNKNFYRDVTAAYKQWARTPLCQTPRNNRPVTR